MYDKSQLMKGTLEGCILQILSETVTYGYEIVTTLTEFGFEDVKEGSIYPLLVRLEKKGMISSELRPSPLGPKRKYYSLTAEGQAYLQEFIKCWTEVQSEKEINQMIEDITGMAEEAQERNENFETVLGKSVHEFCDDLIYSVGGIRAPGGRKLIRGTSIYFQLLGLWGIVGCLINVCFLAGERVHTLWMLAISIGIWYLGHYGEANCNNTEKTKQLTAGIVIYMGVNLLMYCNEIIIAIDNGKAFLKTSDFPILIIGIIVNFGPAILYLVGARRNRPAGEQIKVENR